jgi:hypothetical protein
MDQAIASEKIVAHRPDGQSFEITLEIGTPYLVDEEKQDWACPVSLSPLYKDLGASQGTSSFQALCLASSLVLCLLQKFRQKGGLLFYPSGEEFDFEPYTIAPYDHSKA